MSTTHKETHLSRVLADGSMPVRATPLDVFRMARRRWLKEQRLNLADLAKEAGIGRATLFRWIGSKDLLIQEILWSLYEPVFTQAAEETPGKGPEYVVGVHRRVITEVLTAEPMQRFLKQEPEYALRTMTSSTTMLHQRVVALTREHLEKQLARGDVKLPLPADRFAEIMTRINKSLMFSEGEQAHQQAIEEASTLMRTLLK